MKSLKGIALAYPGTEDIVAQEIEERLGNKGTVYPSCVVFEVNHCREICQFAYQTRSAGKVFILLTHYPCDSDHTDPFHESAKWIRLLDLHPWVNAETTFAVRCTRVGSHSFSKTQVEEELGGFFSDALTAVGIVPHVDLENPSLVFTVYIYHRDWYVGIDVTDLDISKRDYKVFLTPSALKGPVAYSLLRMAGYKAQQKEVLLDPLCGCGTIPIEAALYEKSVSPHFFQKEKFHFQKLLPMANENSDALFANLDQQRKEVTGTLAGFDPSFHGLSAARKNAKIADVHKAILWSRCDLEWLDTKFKEQSVHRIVTQLPVMTKVRSSKEIEPTYKEFFYQANYILHAEGKIVVISSQDLELLLKEYASNYDFKQTAKRSIIHGKMEETVLIYEKQKNRVSIK
ncbi:hypothetical protein HYW21_07360 [Candidatus Woesearchaeota archaeon]|nr:hypothetical protein [Candidatus Woesearchaeota archaeon]